MERNIFFPGVIEDKYILENQYIWDIYSESGMQAAGGNYIFYRYAKDRSGKCFDH
jgi:hypothetical protein